MRLAQVIGFVLSAAAVHWCAQDVLAGVVYSRAVTGDWSDPLTWQGNAVPLPGDRAIIIEGALVTVTADATIDTISVRGAGGGQPAAELDIAETKTLTLRNLYHNGYTTNLAPDDSHVDGRVVLLDAVSGGGSDGGNLAFTSRNHAISGMGAIVGRKNAFILVDTGLTLTNELATAGQGIRAENIMYIQSLAGDEQPSATLNNQGIVAAGAGGILQLYVGLHPTDIAGAQWNLESPGSVMRFWRKASDLHGDFRCFDCATYAEFDIYAFVSTCGTYYRGGSGVTIGGPAGSEFDYASFVPGLPDCGNPRTTCPGDPSCTNPYRVTSTVFACSPCP